MAKITIELNDKDTFRLDVLCKISGLSREETVLLGTSGALNSPEFTVVLAENLLRTMDIPGGKN